MTCRIHKQDVLFHVLYGSNTDYLHNLIEESVINIAQEYPSDGVREILQRMRPSPSDSPQRLQARFFMLLNEDEKMRRQIEKVESSVISPLCPHKGRRFYDEMADEIFPTWIERGDLSLSYLVDTLRGAYLHS